MFKKEAINIMKTRVFSDFEILGGKFMNKNFKSKLVAGLMTTAMLFSSAAAFAPVHAALNESNGTDGYKSPKVSFKKYFVYSSDFIKSPSASFNFEIAPYAPQTDESTTGTQNIYAGPNGATLTSKQIDFNSNSKVYSNVDNGDLVALGAGKKYSKGLVEVNFENVTFTKPGIYRYKITETTNDERFTVDDSVKALDLYVVRDNNNGYHIQNYVMHNDENSTYDSNYVSSDNNNPNGELTKGKSDGFVNTLISYNLAFEKSIAGNQADPNDKFKFTLNVKTLPNTSFKINKDQISNGINEQLTGINEVTNSDNSKTYVVTTDDKGEATVSNIIMKAGDRFAVYGLAKNASYSVKEEANTLGYSLNSITHAGADKSGTLNEATSTVTDDKLVDNADFAFVNTKTGGVPTGIIFAVAPFAVGAVVLAAFIIVKMRRTAKQ